MVETHEGGCLCGSVRFRLHGALRPVVACHCSQCRRQSGHFAAFTGVSDASSLEFVSSGGLDWYAASAEARRGFCKQCGSLLFWKPVDAERISVAAGSLDRPTGLKLERHIFCADKGDYYEIEDGVERLDAW